ncbi:MAG: domain containing protein [Frankiales bacterium]|nr:domain containing protein [Frankiales bacterium]
MGVLQRFERRLEGLVQGAFARAFGGWVEPVEVAAALTREAEDKKAIVAAGRVLVPNTYTVELAHSDAERLKEYDEPLRKELGDMVAEAAQEQGWSFVGPVEVRFEEVDGLGTGAFRVRSAVVAGEAAMAWSPEAHQPSPDQPAGASTPPYLEHGAHTIPLTASTVVGRGAEADVQLTDTGVSRRHAELQVVDDLVQLRDLGSTNGTRVNGQPVSALTLTDGDRITVGASELVFRSGR